MSIQKTRKQSKGLFYHLVVIGYIGLMTIAFYVSAERQGIIPVLPTILRYACDAGVIALAVIYYLVTYMQNRLRAAGTLAWIWSVPYIGMAMISLAIWIIGRMELNYIIRGLINVGCAELNALAVVCAIWMFGEKAVDYTFLGAVAAVLLVALRAMMDYGIGGFLGQYIMLVLTFADNTGPAMKHMEFHDLSQGLGLFVMYYVWILRKDKRGILLLFVSLICFTLTLKRIDVLAIIGGLFMGYFVRKLTYRSRWYFFIAFEAALLIFAYAYLIIIKMGYYKIIMDSLGIDPMSRDIIYDYYKDFFEMSPDFLGKGLRYIYVHTMETDHVIHVTHSIKMNVITAHNEYMTYFIELGFWGYIFWLWSNTWYKVNAFRRKFGWDSMTFTMMFVFYAFISYATDNTYFYYSINYVGFVTSGVLVLSSTKVRQYEYQLYELNQA